MSRSLATLLFTGHAGVNANTCWIGVFTEELCCNRELYGPEGNTACWSGDFTFSSCCLEESSAEVFEPIGLPDKKLLKEKDTARRVALKLDASMASFPPSSSSSSGDLRSSRQILQSASSDISNRNNAHEVSRTCWRRGYSFFSCCTRDQPGGNPMCWDGFDFTFEKCCHPAIGSRAAFLFEDINCEHSAGQPWTLLREDTDLILTLIASGELRNHAETLGGTRAWAKSLEDRSNSAEAIAECPLGRATVLGAVLLLCLADSLGCEREWDVLAAALQAWYPQVTQLASTSWSLLETFQHISVIVTGVDGEDPSCSDETNLDWSIIKHAAVAHEIPDEVMRVLLDEELWKRVSMYDGKCEAGHLWQTSFKLNWCARSELQCVSSYTTFLDYQLRFVSVSGSRLRQWVSRVGEWLGFQWQILLFTMMRHHYSLSLNFEELKLLGIVAEVVPSGCLDVRRSDVHRHFGHGSLHLIVVDFAANRRAEHCITACGGSQPNAGESWAFFGLPTSYRKGEAFCACATRDVQSDFSAQSVLCNQPEHIVFYDMPKIMLPDKLKLYLLESGYATPVLSQAAGSVTSMDPGTTVFVTMVFGHMSRYFYVFSERVRQLEIPNVVVFVLDDQAERACRGTQSVRGPQMFCLRGYARSTLQKYVAVFTYLSLGYDVFWFDFDSVWLRNPAPVLNEIIKNIPSVDVLSAIDFDSLNCAMNAFFWVRATESMRTWFLALMHWIYERPWAHDQDAFTMFLGVAPLVDDTPIPKPPSFGALDPNVFANAARFAGVGFSGEVDDIVLFHFFDGWNSGVPGEVEEFATPLYRGMNVFELLYSDDPEVAKATIEKSRLPPAKELRDCRYRKTMGLGVSLPDHMAYYLAI